MLMGGVAEMSAGAAWADVCVFETATSAKRATRIEIRIDMLRVAKM